LRFQSKIVFLKYILVNVNNRDMQTLSKNLYWINLLLSIV